ncbi:hypothetical protein Hanom_Chr00s000003g01603791 [Helianthus anomalus]
MKMTFKGKEDVATETIQTPFSKNWYQDLKDVPSIELPEKALIVAGMSIFWRMEREEKPVYMEDVVSLYIVAFEREGGSMATIPKKADEELWYIRILTNLGIGPEKKRRTPAANVALKKTDTAKAQWSKAKNVKERRKKPKAVPRDAADISASNADNPIDLESSPEPLLKTKAGKRKQVEVDAEAQPAKKVQIRKINRRGNLAAFIVKPHLENPVSPVHAEPSSAVNEDLPLSPLRAPVSGQLENTKAVDGGVADKTAEVGNPEVEKPVEVVVETEKVVDPETAKVDSAHLKSPEAVARDSEKGKSAQEDPVTIFLTSASAPVNGTFPLGEIQFQDGRLHEQTYHAYLEEAATYTSTTHRIVREWRSMHKEWFAFEASKKKAAEDEARAALLRAKLEADRAKFEKAEADLLSKECKNWREICEKDNNEKIGLRNIINNLKAELERLKKQDADIEKLKQEKAYVEAARDEARSHRERSEQREVWTCATLALRDKEIDELTALLSEQEQIKAELESAKKDLQLERVERAETSRRLNETEEKLESSETARVTAESQLEPLKNDMLWLKDRGIISVANSVHNAAELDETVAHLLAAARNDGYAQGYVECSHHVVNALKVDWDTSRSATHGVHTEAAVAAAKTQFNTLQLPIMDLVTVALQ